MHLMACSRLPLPFASMKRHGRIVTTCRQQSDRHPHQQAQHHHQWCYRPLMLAICAGPSGLLLRCPSVLPARYRHAQAACGVGSCESVYVCSAEYFGEGWSQSHSKKTWMSSHTRMEAWARSVRT